MDEAGQIETWEYQGGSFTNESSWEQIGAKRFSELGVKSVYNLDYENPLESGYYTSESAHKAVPEGNRLLNLIIIYKISESETVKEQFVGNSTSASDWVNVFNWIQIRNENILKWQSDNATTRNQVPYGNRVEGTLLTYKRDDRYWITEIFVGDNIRDWTNDANWRTVCDDIELKTSLLRFDFPKTKNLLNPEKVVRGYFANRQGGLSVNASYCYVDIPFNGNNLVINTAGRGGFCYAFDKNGIVRNITNQQAGTVMQYSEDLAYARFSFNYEAIETVQVEYGDEISEYVPYDGFITKSEAYKLIDEALSPSTQLMSEAERNEIRTYKNRCNPEQIEYGKWIGKTGVINSSSEFAITGYIPIFQGETLYINIDSNLAVIYNAIYDEDLNLLGTYATDQGTGVTYIEDAAYVRYTIQLKKTLYVQIGLISVIVSTEKYPMYYEFGKNENKDADTTGINADYLIIPVYGQSLSMGNGLVLKTDNESYNNVTADNGISGSPSTYTSIVAIPNDTGNTVAQSVSQYISKLLQNGEHKDLSIFTTSQGSGGQPIANLAKSQKIIDIVQKTADYAMKEGKSVNVPTIVWIQGEADQEKTYNYYLEAQVSMIRYLNREIKSLTGQKNDVVFSCYQTGSYEKASNKDVQSEIPKVQFDLNKEYPLFRIMSAIYALPFNDDQLHVNNVGSRIMGATIANGIVNMLYYNKRSIVQISNVSVYKSSSEENWLIRLVIDAPSLPIVIDKSPKYCDYGSDVEEEVPHYGFELKIDGSDIITGISLSKGNVINIVVNQDPTGQVLYYAKRGNQGGGYIRDSQGNNYKCLVNGEEYRCDNWLPIQEIKL